MRLKVASRLFAAGLTLCLAQVAPALAQDGGYVSPSFFGGQAEPQAQPLPQFPASPLAGGPAAAQGGQFMDVQGNPIILPAGYCDGCPGGGGGYGGYSPSGAGGVGGNGDPMAVDFGGYGADQCGPHYFDVAFDVVFMIPQDPFAGVGPLISVGVDGPRIDATSNQEEYEAGWQIAFRYDIGPLSVLEATYLGIYDFGFNTQVISAEATVQAGLPSQQFQLFTAFSNFGVPVPIDGLDDGNVYTLNYESDLQSTEISYRRYWVGHNPRVSGTLLCGARYLRMTEEFNWDIVALAGDSQLSTDSENDLVGFQFGGDGWLCLRQGLRIGAEVKTGIYNNRFKLNKAGVFPDVGNAPPDFAVQAEGNQVAFAAESGVTMVADILPSWSLRGGYKMLYLNSLATIGDNIDPNDVTSTQVLTQSHQLYHGFHGGLEYIW